VSALSVPANVNSHFSECVNIELSGHFTLAQVAGHGECCCPHVFGRTAR
jgi:hypothetical protein